MKRLEFPSSSKNEQFPASRETKDLAGPNRGSLRVRLCLRLKRSHEGAQGTQRGFPCDPCDLLRQGDASDDTRCPQSRHAINRSTVDQYRAIQVPKARWLPLAVGPTRLDKLLTKATVNSSSGISPMLHTPRNWQSDRFPWADPYPRQAGLRSTANGRTVATAFGAIVRQFSSATASCGSVLDRSGSCQPATQQGSSMISRY